MRIQNLKSVERQLLELINVTESFAATGDEALAILQNCSIYMKGPIGQALGSIEKRLQCGWSGKMVLEQMKIMLEHPKWQEFIHNLNVCCMYNSDFNYVFRSSRKSIQAYLSAKKERQSVKHTAQMEMGIIVFLGMIIIIVLGQFLSISIQELLWGSILSRGCTIYMIGIVLLFYWKIGAYEKE
jgi:Flp pilus assembly protein TadB